MIKDAIEKARLRIDGARFRALSNEPFYGALCMRLLDKFDAPGVPTAATNGVNIYWNTDFVQELNDDQLYFVLLHETMHCAHGHLWRLPLDKLANVACDFVINLIVQDIKGTEVPPGDILLDKKWANMAEEEVYLKLKEEAEAGGGGYSQEQIDACGSYMDDGSGQNNNDGKDQPQDGSSGSIEGPSIEQQWDAAVIQAAQIAAASDRGSLPAGMERRLKELTAVQVDWRQETADFVRTAVGARNDWSRPARRHAWQSVIYPRRMQDGLGTIIFARDTSGSVDDDTLSKYSALISSCMADTGCSALILDCDTVVHKEYRVDPSGRIPLKAKGGGGTSFEPVFERAKEIGEEETIAGIVYLSDMYGSFPSGTEFPTLWLATSDEVAPFGRTVRVY